MKLKDPRITVQNTDTQDWLVNAEGLVSASDGLESISFTVAVPRSGNSLPEVTRSAIERAIFLLQQHLDLNSQKQ